jgi:hypothetical protein
LGEVSPEHFIEIREGEMKKTSGIVTNSKGTVSIFVIRLLSDLASIDIWFQRLNSVLARVL